ncbi:hypothetical protein [Pseudomonas cichorii]|uniref:hypothetical protein n=1 Tax=Pseudomonas cichorii TaxID=36746 RepID=UPI0021A97E3E|nr:hypothetical protein [Pseudomonas cichorii]
MLDEIDDRLSVIEAISRLAEDPETDELHTLHPLWPTHLPPETSPSFRRPGDDDSMRSLAEICLQELAALVSEMQAKGHVADALIQAVAREAGVSKLAHAGRLRIEKAIRHSDGI